MRRNKKPNYTEEQLGQFNQDFSDDMPMSYAGLCALVHFWRDEHDKVLHAYQNKMAEISMTAMDSIKHPNGWGRNQPRNSTAMNCDDFKRDFDQALAAMSDDEIEAAFARMGCAVTITERTTDTTTNTSEELNPTKPQP